MNKLEFSKLNKKEDMILAFNQLKDDYRQLFAINDDLQSKIDKANEIDKIARKYFNKQIPRNIREQGFLNEIYNYLCDIEDILK